MMSTGLQAYLIANPWPLFVSMGIAFGTLIAIMCNPTLARSYPHNYTLLAVFTLAEAVSIGFVCMVRLHLLLRSPSNRALHVLCVLLLQFATGVSVKMRQLNCNRW